MEYVKSKSGSSAKFYILLYSGTSLIVLGYKALQDKIRLEQTTRIITLALSIILQALPFILIGVFISSLIQILIREEWIAKLAPNNSIAGIIVGALLGLFFPVCDCGVMPVARSLLCKGVSMPTAFAYLLTAPVINPVTILATALAFQWNWQLVVMRIAGTFIVGSTTAFYIGKFFKPTDFKIPKNYSDKNHNPSHKQTIHTLFLHAVDEFFDIGCYLILSAFLASAIQVWVPQTILFQFINNPFLSIGSMMILAMSMSLCSAADAFVARILANQFSLGGILSFLIIGQILDLRNIILFSKNFRPSLFIFLGILSFILTFLWGLGINFSQYLHII